MYVAVLGQDDVFYVKRPDSRAAMTLSAKCTRHGGVYVCMQPYTICSRESCVSAIRENIYFAAYGEFSFYLAFFVLLPHLDAKYFAAAQPTHLIPLTKASLALCIFYYGGKEPLFRAASEYDCDSHRIFRCC